MQDLAPSLVSLNDATEKALQPLPAQPAHVIQIRINEDGSRFFFRAVRTVYLNGLASSIAANIRNGPDEVLVHNGQEIALRTSYDRKFCAWIERIPGIDKGSGNNKEFRHCPATDQSALLFRIAWGYDRIIADDETRLAIDGLISRFMLENKYVQAQAQFKLNKELPPLPANLVQSEVYPLSDYQRMAVYMLYEREGAALFMEQGTGKTACAVSTSLTESKAIDNYRVIVICPGAVRGNWAKEFVKFKDEHTTVRTTVVKGTQMERRHLLIQAVREPENEDCQVVIMSLDTVVNDVKFLCAIGFHRAIIDESHKFKSEKSARYRAYKQLREFCKRRTVLTGTPIGNSIMDLYTQFEFLYEGASGFSTFKEFRKFYGRFKTITVDEDSNHSIEKLIGYNHLPFFQERMARLSFQITKKEAGLNLPEKVYDTWEVEFEPEQRAIYQSLATQLCAEIDDGLSKGTINADHVLTKLLRLAQVTGGFATTSAEYDEESGEETVARKVHDLVELNKNPKIVAVKEMMETNRKAVVWACTRRDVDNLEELCRQEGWEFVSYHGRTNKHDRETAEDRFNKDPNVRMFIGNPDSAGAGLNLLGYDVTQPDEYPIEDDCSLMIFYSQNWSRLLRAQAEDRTNRRGSRVPLIVRDLIVPETVDQEIRERVAAKTAIADNVMDYIESVLKPSIGFAA